MSNSTSEDSLAGVIANANFFSQCLYLVAKEIRLQTPEKSVCSALKNWN